MGELLAQVIPLALGAAISPVVLLLMVATLTGERSVARGVAVAVGAAVPLVVLGAVVLAAGAAVSLDASPTLARDLDFVFGAVLLALGARALLRGPSPVKTKSHAPTGPRRSLVLGAAAMSTNVTTLALYVPAMKLISESDVDFANKALATALVLVITLATVLMPLAILALAPRASARLLGALGNWMQSHHRAITVAVCFGFGIFLLIRGLSA